MLIEIPGWHLGFLNNICFKESAAIPGHGAGKQGVLGGLEFLTGMQMWAWRPGIHWISCSSLDCHSLGTGTKPGSGVWVALAPWELLRRADPMDCWSWHTGKSDYFGLPSAPRAAFNTQEKGIHGEKLCRFATTALKPFQDFSMFLKRLLDFVSHHFQFKTLGIIPVPSFFHGKSKHDFGSRNPGGCCWVPSKSRAAFQFKPSINLIFVILIIPDPCLRWELWKSWNALSVFLVGSATSCPHDSSVLLAFSGYFCNVPMDA